MQPIQRRDGPQVRYHCSPPKVICTRKNPTDALLNLFPRRLHWLRFNFNRARGKDARGLNVDQYCKSARDNVGRVVGARAAAMKNCLFRYTVRWHEIAVLHRLLETGSNRRPARGTLDMMERAMRGETLKGGLVGHILTEYDRFSSQTRCQACERCLTCAGTGSTRLQLQLGNLRYDC